MLFCYWILSQWLNLHWVTRQPLLLTAPLPNTAEALIAIFTFSFYFGQGFAPLICAFLLIRNPGCNEEHDRSVSSRVVCVCGDPHVDGENEHLWLLASLVLSCALKGRQSLSITPAVKNQLVIIVLTGGFFLCFHNARCILTVDASKGNLRLSNLAQSASLHLPLLISSLQSYSNQCSLLSLCGINVTEINFTIFFSPH